jgi:uncharacterized protein YbcV (DUF1398 family)
VFTLEQIDDIHKRLGKRSSLPEYLKALRAIGVERYDSFISDGHSEYYGTPNLKVVSLAVHAILTVAEKSDRDKFLNHLRLHEQGQTNYFEMSRGLAESGIEKWTFDTSKMTIAYYDRAGQVLLKESIK